MKKILFCLAAVLVALGARAKEDEARLLRFPATNGNEIVFTYAGDLWSVPVTGGQARRLTSHMGYEGFAHYSPDGKTIAFTAEYDGNREVYRIPAGGGEPVRLTWTSTNSRDEMGDRMGPNNMVMAWTPDGKQIIFRNRISDGFSGKLWSVSPDGGMPTEIPLPEGGWCSFSADGKKMAYNRVMREFRTWKYYRGGMADDVWIWDRKGGKVENITNNIAQDIFPMWIGNEIFFASDRDMIMNIFVYDTKTKKTEKVTDFDLYDVKFPTTDGKTIVFENGGYIYRLDPATRKYEQVHITLAGDDIYGRSERRKLAGNVTGASLSHNGERLAVTARGEVFDVPVGRGVTRNLTRSSASNDRDAEFSPDGKWIAWIGDATGETEVYLYEVEKGGEARQITSGSDTYIRSLQWSPDSRHILYTDRKNRIVEVSVPDGGKKVIMTNPEAEFRRVEYSPDSKWITYTRPAKNEMDVIYVYNLESGKEYPVTERWYDSGSPTFSSDGKYLVFTADRDIHPQYGRVEWNYVLGNMSGIYITMLAADTPSPLLPKDGMPSVNGGGRPGPGGMFPPFEGEESLDGKGPRKGEGKPEFKGKGPGAPDGKDDGKKEDVVVKIDPEGLAFRTVKIPVSGEIGWGGMYCDGKKLWYSAGFKTRVFDFASGKDDECAEGSVVYRNGDKKAILMKGRRDISVADFGAKMSGGDKPDLSGMATEIDFGKEWAQIYDEVWRAFRDGYYLENMHGRNWQKIKDKYAVLLPHVKTRLDLNYVIGEMISEVASGHAYVTVGEYPKPERISMGLLGAEFSRDKSGYFRIEKILQGAPYDDKLRSPLTEPGMGISKGEYITAIDGVPTNTVANIYQLLVGKADVLTELTVSDKATAGGRKVVVKPISDEYPLYHYEWIQKNIATCDRLSGGKIGYIYIPDMGPEGLSEFARYYYPQLDKEALIIDDRANGGGNVSPMIIERLQREVYRMTMRRGSTLTGTVPDATHTGPKVLLIDKYSASDGDLFPWSFKANNLGTVVGTRTWGGIVGISGSLPYVDGTDVRVPFFTNYDAKTGQWIVENHGVDPDILIDNDPVKEFAGEDQQLLKAIEVAMEQLKERKPLPGVPAPRTFPDLGLPQIE
ncbi:MAG: PDZ domain-containing protein [Bacteroidales bacterium]|nr:PDZ domain-containing protein [Bacteroidales bacterium]